MKHVLLFLLLLLAGNTAFAQDYAPLPDTGIRRYFTNSAGYLRGIRVDSVVQETGYKRYVTFRTARGLISNYGSFSYKLNDSAGACWLGKNVRAYPNGDWQFPNQYGDTVLIKTAATIGSTWVFYTDTAATWFEAQVTSQDTQIVFGILDSVKTVTLTAKIGNSVVSGHPLNGWQFVLSKSQGFATIPDLHLFPYRDFNAGANKRDPWYSMLQPASVAGTIDYLVFNHFVHIVPNKTQIFDFQPGDIFHYNIIDPNLYISDVLNVSDTFISRMPLTNGDLNYRFKRWRWTYNQLRGAGVETIDISSEALYHTMFLDTSLLPEEYSEYQTTRIYIYKVAPSPSWCGLTTDTIWHVCTGPGNRGLHLDDNSITARHFYQKGLGRVAYIYHGLGEGLYREEYLKFVTKSEIPCGMPVGTPPNSIRKLLNSTTSKLYPQPATTEVFLEAPNLRYPATVHIQNLQGQLLSTQKLSTAGKPITTASLPAGLYLISVKDAGGNSVVQKLLIEGN